MILSIGALAISTAINYLIVYMPTYAVKTLNLPPTVGFAATFAAGIALTFLTPIAGHDFPTRSDAPLVCAVSLFALVVIRKTSAAS